MEDLPKEAKEERVDTEVETSDLNPEPLGQPIVYTPSGKKCLEEPAELSDTEEDPTSLEELEDRVVEDVGRTLIKQQPAPSSQVSSGTVILDNNQDPSAEEPKLVGLSAADMLNKQVIPLLRYLDGKLEKYAGPSIARSYVELMRNRTRAKVATSIETTKRVQSLST